MSYHEQLQNLYRRYENDGHMQPFTMHDLASWAYDNALCQPQRSTMVSRLAEDFSRAMRADFHVDPQGRRVRTKHVATFERGGSSSLSGPICEPPHGSIWSAPFSRGGRESLEIAAN